MGVFQKSIEENMVTIKTKNLLPNTNSLLDAVVSTTKHQTIVNDIMTTTIVDCSLYEYIMKWCWFPLVANSTGGFLLFI